VGLKYREYISRKIWKNSTKELISIQGRRLQRRQKVLLFIVSLLKSEAMNVNIQTVHFEADNKLVDYVNKKLSRLDTFHDRIVKVEVYLKLDNVVHTIKDKIAEIKVHVPRQDYFVKCSSKSFEESFDKAMGSLINLIKRKKDKQAA
jgi:putative sigma-54 modulation protein